jgi:tRNA (guanine37-N1)-methyltransferase
MRFDIFTIFPEFFDSPLRTSILKRARENDVIQTVVHDLRAYTRDRHRVVDDYPYGGGVGMVMKPEPFFEAVESVLQFRAGEDPAPCPVILLSPQGRTFTQSVAQELAQHERLALLCGHYEGVDERVAEHLATDEISVGDFVLTGGEIPALAIVDAVSRLLPGVLGHEQSAQTDSFSAGLLEYPQFTRPADFRGWKVPDVLLSGHHGDIARWRQQQSLQRTQKRRPDLMEEAERSNVQT